MQASRSHEQGAAKVLIVIVLLILAVLAYAGVQLVPLYWDHEDLEETIQTTMISALVPPHKDVEATVKRKIITMLDDMGAQYNQENIKVDVSDDYKTIHVEVWYARSHHLPWYPNPKQFYLKLDHKVFLPTTIDLPKRTPLPDLE
jgi:hypothetical protein